MRKYNHPNILPLYCSFVHEQELWMVMPFVAGGSVLHIMKYGHPEGLNETIIATIGREVLKGLDYVHKNGSIHRDVKAGNILVDGDGNVKLGDFGVAASLERGGSWGHDKQARMTFVGTPCWMAPEVMEQTSGYDFSADIWSFGITLLEMCHGHAPFAKFPPMKVLLMTLQNPAPTLEDKGQKHFSKALKDLVTRCLQKEKDKRPTAAQLLEHRFFKIAKDAKYLKDNLVGELPPLSDRVNRIRTGMAATNKQDNDRNLEKSQEEYRKGVSSWNFDLAALKAQAALEPDDETTHGANMLPTITESDEREETMTGTSAAVATPVEAERTAPQPTGAVAGPYTSTSTASVFATMNGQDATLRTNAIVPLLTSAASDGGGVSPATGLSREGSLGGNLADARAGQAATPTGGVLKQKKGRFEVSVHADVPASSAASAAAQALAQVPTMPASVPLAAAHPSVQLAHAPNSIGSNTLASMSTGSGVLISGGTVPDLQLLRGSTPGLDAASESRDEFPGTLLPAKTEVEESVTSVEPKQRGRFKIVAEQGTTSDSRPLSKASSMANLSDSNKDPSKQRSDGGNLSGKPPTAPTSMTTSVSVVLPKLQELMDHASAHQAALQRSEWALTPAEAHQKLIGAVQECEKGRVPLLLSRTQSTKSLFETSPSEAADDLRLQVVELRAKLSALEDENTRLRERNKVLETLHSAAHTVRFTLPAEAASAPGGGATSPKFEGAPTQQQLATSQPSLA
ncbi:hypothetical protein VOLCADRAFT_105178 [Volvox carteri f. nagariensis]|uniref:Protein kinase domain-containing protein n=1 Tax=Volvox carteri f. nagariensis TaxID=3068 RepID=D8TZ24_VOLCA|nr:uncharacterized protein VOLCADRAFT_105178 [Volvox carteri f. nagariensis]EFJ47105.1 hypothetical protein VOLCADRAFT_105178 [Volvox carteri f. nagariensis]|eukprot:XP_002951654.1 hypothetical protein VOLCADRAFT_105178 [Volvox carteri f. nagariensis]